MKSDKIMQTAGVFLWLLFLVVPPALAGERAAAVPPKPQTGRPVPGPKPAPPTRPRPTPSFTPSEKIGADTVIALPVDI
ncbi:hypothetical protein ACLG6S_07420 [Thermodesulfobacteriota bacterium B35]